MLISDIIGYVPFVKNEGNVALTITGMELVTGAPFTLVSVAPSLPCELAVGDTLSYDVSIDTTVLPGADDSIIVTYSGGLQKVIPLVSTYEGTDLADGPEVTTIYPSTVMGTIATTISDTIISDPAERARWSSDVSLQPGYNKYWVAPDVPIGTGSGTEEDPWDLFSTLNAVHTVLPNSMILCEEGDYFSPLAGAIPAEDDLQDVWQIKLTGTQDNPIHIRPKLGARVRIDGGIGYMSLYANHIWLWDVEVTALPNDDWRRSPNFPFPVEHLTDGLFYQNVRQYILDNGYYYRSGVNIYGGIGNRLINTWISAQQEGIGSWKSCAESHLYGNIVFDNGWAALDRLHGPGLYVQNESGAPRYIHENIVPGNFSNPFQIYTATDAGLGSIDAVGNVVFGARYFGGESYFSPRADVMFGDNGGDNQRFEQNYIYGHALKTDPYDPVNNRVDYNYVIYSYTSNCEACSQSTNVVEPIAMTRLIHIRPNKYDPSRANLIIVNPDRDPIVSIDLGTWAEEGDYVRVYNSTDPSEPVKEGYYNGSFFNLPMDGSPTPDWIDQPAHGYIYTGVINPADSYDPVDYSTAKHEFWAFVLMKG